MDPLNKTPQTPTPPSNDDVFKPLESKKDKPTTDPDVSLNEEPSFGASKPDSSAVSDDSDTANTTDATGTNTSQEQSELPDTSDPANETNSEGEGTASTITPTESSASRDSLMSSSTGPTTPDNGSDQQDVPATAPTAVPSRPKKKFLFVGLIVAAVVLVLGAGAAAAYLGYILPNKPENVLKRALVNSMTREKASTMHFEGEGSVASEGAESMQLNFKGGATYDGKLDFSADIDALITTITLDLRSTDGKSYFLKVGGLDGLADLMALGGDESGTTFAPLLKSVNDQWYEINQSLVNQTTGTSFDFAKVSEEDVDKIVDIYKKNEFLVVKETLKSEKIKGVDSHHLKVGIEQEKLRSFLKALKEANIDNLKITDQGLAAFSNLLNDSDLSKNTTDVWIAKDTKMFNQFQFKISESGSDVNFRLTITDYNKPVNVEKPEGAKSILEVITSFMSSLGLDGAQALPLNLEEDASGVSL